MLESGAQQPLGENESFHLERGSMAEIRDGDLVESTSRKVTSINEEERERILKSLDKQSPRAKSVLESVRVGMLIDDATYRFLEGTFGPLFQTKTEKSRVMYIYPHTGGATVWIGPPELTVADVALFKYQIKSDEPHGVQFERCRPVDIADVKKVLDS